MVDLKDSREEIDRIDRQIVERIILIAIVTGIILWSRASSKIHYNDEGTVGNSAGNLYNGGLF